MRNSKRYLPAGVAALLATLALFVLAAPAGASGPEKGIPHGALSGNLTAVADSVSTVGSCGTREVMLFAIQNTDGSKFVDATVDVYDCAGNLTSRHNGCAVEPHSAGDECAALGDFEINDDRTAASLDTSVPLYDVLSSSDPPPQVSTLGINVDWTGVGGLRSEMIHYELGKTPVGDETAIIINLDHESCRDASLAGTVSEDGGATNYLDGATVESHLCEQIPGSTFLYVFPFK